MKSQHCAVAGLFGLVQLFRIRDKFARLILAGQVAGIILFLTPVNTIVTIGRILSMAMILLVIIYAIIKKDLQVKKKTFILLISVPVFTKDVFAINHYPYAEEIGLAMLIPIIAYLILVLTDIKRYTNELGFLTILTADAVVRLSANFG